MVLKSYYEGDVIHCKGTVKILNRHKKPAKHTQGSTHPASVRVQKEAFKGEL